MIYLKFSHTVNNNDNENYDNDTNDNEDDDNYDNNNDNNNNNNNNNNNVLWHIKTVKEIYLQQVSSASINIIDIKEISLEHKA